LIEDICFAQGVVNPDLKISIHADAGPIEIAGDERLLGQALGNVIRNAAEALASRPESDETIGQIEVNLTPLDDNQVEITITDNGPGFPADVKAQLLEPYVTAKEGGTGLGLAIVNRIIMDHGGEISLQHRSDDQSGAMVRIVMPIKLAGLETPIDEQVEYIK